MVKSIVKIPNVPLLVLVVYFNQPLGAAQAKPWPKYAFSHFSH